MAGLNSVPQSPPEESAERSARNARYGMILFVVYLAVYGTFVTINAFQPAWMDVLVFGGVNLAVVYGLGLIVAALVMAVLYGWLCRSTAAPAMKDQS